jgi:hypothetical protein
MSDSTPTSVPSAGSTTGSDRVKRGLAEMLKGGVIMDVVNVEQAKMPRTRGRWPSWHSSACPPTSARRAASPA